MCPVGWLEDNLTVVAHIPTRVPPYSSCQLNIPGLDGHPPGMNSQQVGILHDAHHKHLCSLVKGIHCLFLPVEGAGVALSLLQICLAQVGCLHIPPV